MTQLAGCLYCYQIVMRGAPGELWRVLPRRGEVLYPEVAALCLAAADGFHRVPGTGEHA